MVNTEVRRHRFPPPPVAPFPDVNVVPTSKGPDVFSLSDVDGESEEELDLFSAVDVYTIDQDLFLVRHTCFQPPITHNDLLDKFQREFGESKSLDDLMARIKLLLAADFNGLLALYVKAVAMNLDNRGNYPANAPSVRTEYQAILLGTRTSCETKLLQLLYEDEKMQNESSEVLLVEGVTLHSPDTSNEKLHLTDGAPFYDSCMVFNHLEQPIFDRLVHFAKDPSVMERLTLQKQQLEEGNQIKRDLTLQLETLFDSQRKLLVARLEESRATEFQLIKRRLERTLEEDIAHIRSMHDKLVRHERAKVDAKFDSQLHRLNQQIEHMKSDIFDLEQSCRENGWSTLERDILQNTLQVERIFGTSDYLLRLLILAEDLEAEPLRRAIVRYLTRPRTLPQFALRREFTSKMISESTVLAIFKAATTEDLREIDHDLTSGPGGEFIYHELLTRELHTRRVTLARFLASLTNDHLRVISRCKSLGILAMETSAAAAAIAATLGADAALVTPEMLAPMRLVHDFPDVLDREFARRREFSCVKMNSAMVLTGGATQAASLHTAAHDVSFSDDDCVVQLEASHRYCTVLATKERKQGESGRWMFEITIEAFDGSDSVHGRGGGGDGGGGESLLVGWDVPRPPSTTATEMIIPGLTPGADGRSFGVTWQSDGGLDMGMAHANGQSRSGVPSFRAGDVLGCTIDQDELVPYLRFYLNGTQVLPATTSSSTTTAAAAAPGAAARPPSRAAHGGGSGSSGGGIPCQNPIYCLFPVVSMYSSRRKPQMRVRCNFRGGFRFPIPGFEPYGAPL